MLHRYQVQPRVCGEYIQQPKPKRVSIGSTPRMRGISAGTFPDRTTYRFNPAYAGNIKKEAWRYRELQVQPRVCGEYFFVR